ncbi:hypothetical protein BpHYR1_028787 [Brachionus plicatilis]|uniref:Uncharacterized protein n=1 Tax=Brachionus plicatilis TaxID=10195 RepID=A0A3M7SDY5_BRAPC|nr:hypothetical protein BpHYR1_028787 [Brachionus plicatilis]
MSLTSTIKFLNCSIYLTSTRKNLNPEKFIENFLTHFLRCVKLKFIVYFYKNRAENLAAIFTLTNVIRFPYTRKFEKKFLSVQNSDYGIL